jgi:hypothetical protein
MESITEFTIENYGEEEVFIIIDRGNGEFTSLLKSDWEAQQAQKELGGTL